MNASAKRSPFMVGLVFLIFFVISLLTNIIGPLIPDIIKSFRLNLTMVALLPFAFFIAYGVMSVPAGMLVERFGDKHILVGSFIVAFGGARFRLPLLPVVFVVAAAAVVHTREGRLEPCRGWRAAATPLQTRCD